MAAAHKEEFERARHLEDAAYPLLQGRIRSIILRLERGKLDLLHAVHEPIGENSDSHSVILSYRLTREGPLTQYSVWFGHDGFKAAQFVSELKGLSEALKARGSHDLEHLRRVNGFRLIRTRPSGGPKTDA